MNNCKELKGGVENITFLQLTACPDHKGKADPTCVDCVRESLKKPLKPHQSIIKTHYQNYE